MKFYILGLVATFTISSVKGQCQVPGNAKCYSISNPIGPVGSSCCSDAKCQPWLEPGEIFTVPVDWYCMYIQSLGLNEACDNKIGKCARGLNCIAGFCSNQAIPATTPAVTTPAFTTPAITTPAVCDAMAGELCLYTQYNINKTCCSPFVCTAVSSKSSVCKGENLSAGNSCFKTGAGSLGSCAEPLICLDGVCKEPSTECIDPVNGVCYIGDIQLSVGTCCSGSECLAVAGSTDQFCQQQNIPLGGDCNQTEHRGVCDVGLTCTAGTCTTPAVTTPAVTTPAVTTPAVTTPSITTPVITTPAVTTPGACDAMAGELCLYTQYNINKTCCSPFVCTAVSSKSSVCKGENLSAGNSCFKTGAGSLGSCAEPLICLDGVCKEPSTECIDPVNGVCYIGDIPLSVGTCCSGSECLAVAGSTDKFCQQQNIPLGGDCNQTEHRGVCDVGLKCASGACVDKLPEGETCFEAGVGSVGSCAAPLICLNNVCTEPSTTCTDPVNGKCTSFADCCPGSYCLEVADTTVTETYCQQFIQTGGNCNQTEHRGRCVADNFCIAGICVDALSTVPTTPAAACLAVGDPCVDTTTGEKIGDCCPGGGCTEIDAIAAQVKCAAA